MGRIRHRLGLVWGVFECFLFAGVMLGWPLLTPVFKNAGYFAYMCNDVFTNESVTEQPTNVLPTNINKLSENFGSNKKRSPRESILGAATSGENGNLVSNRKTSYLENLKPIFSENNNRHNRFNYRVHKQILQSFGGKRNRNKNKFVKGFAKNVDISSAYKEKGFLGILGNNDVNLTADYDKFELTEKPYNKTKPLYRRDTQASTSQKTKFHDSSQISLSYECEEDDESCKSGNVETETDSSVCTEDNRRCQQQQESLLQVSETARCVMQILSMPIGWFFDGYGTLKTRLIAVGIYAPATLLVSFSNPDISWLLYPASYMISIAGFMIFLTDLQMANLFSRRYTILTLFVGAYYSSTIILYMIRTTNYSGCFIQSSFMFLTSGVVLFLVTTVAFLPKSHIPWPVGSKSDTRRRSSASSDHSIFGVERKLRPALEHNLTFWSIVKSAPFITHIIWFSAIELRIESYEATLDLSLTSLGYDHDCFHKYLYIGQMCNILFMPIFGAFVDMVISKDTTGNKTLLYFIVTSSIMTTLGVTMTILDALPYPAAQFTIFVFEPLLKPSVHAISIIVISSLYPNEFFGKLLGITLGISGVINIFEIVIRHFVKTLGSEVICVHLFIGLVTFSSIAYPIVLWQYRKKPGRGSFSDNKDHIVFNLLRNARGPERQDRSESQATVLCDLGSITSRPSSPLPDQKEQTSAIITPCFPTSEPNGETTLHEIKSDKITLAVDVELPSKQQLSDSLKSINRESSEVNFQISDETSVELVADEQVDMLHGQNSDITSSYGAIEIALPRRGGRRKSVQFEPIAPF